jgi:hypothetical protein
MGLRSESDARQVSNERERFNRECTTPKDDWGNNIDGYIIHLLKIPSYQWMNGELITLTGIESAESHLYDYLEDDSLSCYHQCRHRGYYEWMLQVNERFLKLKKTGKIKKFLQKAKKDTTYRGINPNFKKLL